MADPSDDDGFTPDEHAGVISPRALLAAPGKVRSPRTGRMVAQSTALLEYGQDFDAVPLRSESLHGGLWDHDQEAAMGPRKGPPRPPREDADRMARFVARHSAGMTAHELDVYALFWLRRLSYAEVGREISTKRDRVYECIKRLRTKCKGAGY